MTLTLRQAPKDLTLSDQSAHYKWVLHALLSYWRRNPIQAATLIIGLAIATALFSGVQALNFQARESYANAAAQLGANQLPSLVSVDGKPFDQDIFVKLRRGGWPVSPIVEGRIRVNNQSYRLIGVDIVSLPRAANITGANGAGFTQSSQGDAASQEAPPFDAVDFLTPPFMTLGSPQTLADLGVEDLGIEDLDVEHLDVEDGAANSVTTNNIRADKVLIDKVQASDSQKTLSPLRSVRSMAPSTLITDISVAQNILQQEGMISRLIIDKIDENRLPPISEILGAEIDKKLERVEPSTTSEIARLTDSFHLNLTAFGFLSFFVGLLIVHSAIGLAFEQRRTLFRTLRACGVSARVLTLFLICELVILALLAGGIGILLGYLIAALLLPNVALTLQSLYGARVPGILSVKASWWILGFSMSIAGALLAAVKSLYKAYRLPVLAPAQPEAWRAAEKRSTRYKIIFTGIFFIISLLILKIGGGLIAGFILMGTIVVSAALILPVLLSLVFNFAEKIAIKPISQWFWADGRQQLPGVSLAMQALLVALAVNIGVGAMVSSFRETFTSWLDQRLAAEIYINAQGNDKTSIQSWLNNQQDILAVLPINYAEANFQDEEIPVMGITAHETYSENWPLLSKIEQGWQEVADGSGVLINEQLARRKGISINDKINLETPTGVWSPHIAGIYSDYGNTQGQFMADINQLQSRWERDGANLFLVRSDPKDISGIMKRLAARFNLNETQMVNQQQMKSLSKQIFERTFSVTAALNVLTLIIAGVALLTSLLSLANSRLSQVAPLWAMGLTQGRLSILDLAKTLSLALFTGLLAIPLGIILGWLLTSIINVEAFGWKLPLFHYPFQWLTLIILALTIAGIASIPSIIKLRTISAAKLLKVFSDAR